MHTECDKCLEKLIHKEDTINCNICQKTIHFFCAGLSESNFKKMSKLKCRNTIPIEYVYV